MVNNCPRCGGILIDSDGYKNCLCCGYYDYKPMPIAVAMQETRAFKAEYGRKDYKHYYWWQGGNL